MPPTHDEELAPPPDRTARNALLGFAALAAAGAAAYLVNDRFDTERRGRELQRAADAWADLSRCLAGERPRVGEVARTARRVELGVPASVRQLPRARRFAEWPWRCATHARVLTRALFDSHSDDPRHRLLGQFASVAATDLERAELRTGRGDPRHYLDELFAAAERAGLPPGRRSRVPPPPEPVRLLTPSRLRPLLRGDASLQAEEPADLGALRAVVGRAERWLCDFDADLTAPDCRRVPALDGAARVRLTSSRYPRLPGYVRGDARGVGPLPNPARPEAPALHDRASGAFRTASDAWFVLGEAGEAPSLRYDLYRGAAVGLAVPPLAAAPSSPPWMVGPLFVALVAGGPAAPGDAGVVTDAADAGGPDQRIVAGRLDEAADPWRWRDPPADRGSVGAVAADPVVRGCVVDAAPPGGEETLAVVVYGEGGRASVLWRSGGRFLAVQRAEGAPGAVTCGGGRVRLAWYAPLPVPTAHVTTCTTAGCSHEEGGAFYADAPPRVAALGDRVLAVYSGESFGGLRYRLAPLASLADAREVVVFDDARHEGVDLAGAPVVLARGEAAVALATRGDAPGDTWAVRIDAQGFRALRPRE